MPVYVTQKGFLSKQVMNSCHCQFQSHVQRLHLQRAHPRQIHIYNNLLERLVMQEHLIN
ncbi:hypothetical protein DPMN_101573 [Dreissena polymorpha]|uniref:Uncharacterized protein n=1 Tax=Dreissena polymorpha TaxID=45954 RepID=A0A9D4R984_DREPO|nr:hypothetical protein DPMN_101573 [Dreissena polymorpha]